MRVSPSERESLRERHSERDFIRKQCALDALVMDITVPAGGLAQTPQRA